jgi:hypothetical protein
MEHYCVQLTPSPTAAAAAAAAAASNAAVISDSSPHNPALLQALQAYPVVDFTHAAVSRDYQQGKKGAAAAAADKGEPSAAASVLRAAAAAAAQQKQQAPAVRVAECWVDRQGLYVVVQQKPPADSMPDGADVIPGECALVCFCAPFLLLIWLAKPVVCGDVRCAFLRAVCVLLQAHHQRHRLTAMRLTRRLHSSEHAVHCFEVMLKQWTSYTVPQNMLI